MRLLADLNIAPRTVEFLRSLGHDVVRVDALLPGTASDVEIVEVALREELQGERCASAGGARVQANVAVPARDRLRL